MGTQVSFNYQAWIQRYPEFQRRVTAELAQLYFNEATVYHNNTGAGPPFDPPTQTTLLNMATAHIAELNARSADGEPSSPLVGRIESAAQGSVNVNVKAELPANSAQWWAQTKYGFAYWQAAAPFRLMRYRRGPRRWFDPDIQ